MTELLHFLKDLLNESFAVFAFVALFTVTTMFLLVIYKLMRKGGTNEDS